MHCGGVDSDYRGSWSSIVHSFEPTFDTNSREADLIKPIKVALGTSLW